MWLRGLWLFCALINSMVVVRRQEANTLVHRGLFQPRLTAWNATKIFAFAFMDMEN